MPEGDSVRRTAQRLHAALAGAPLARWDLRWGQAATSDLTGRTTLAVVSRGKHLLHRIDGGVTLHTHLRMEGRWRIVPACPPGRLTDHRIRAVVGTAEWTCIGHSLGGLHLVATADEARVVGHLGPDLLGPDWDRAEAVRRLGTDPARGIAAALLDQRNLAGIGTLYCGETLFLERVHPWRPVGELGVEALGAIVDRARELLRAGVATTSRPPARAARQVYRRAGRACPRCGAVVRAAPIGTAPRDRVVYMCPRCQRFPAGADPDDGGAAAPG